MPHRLLLYCYLPLAPPNDLQLKILLVFGAISCVARMKKPRFRNFSFFLRTNSEKIAPPQLAASVCLPSEAAMPSAVHT